VVDGDLVDAWLDRLNGLVRVARIAATGYLVAFLKALEEVIEGGHIASFHDPLRGFLKEPAKRERNV
jgi:hypothetical protein